MQAAFEEERNISSQIGLYHGAALVHIMPC